MVCAEDQGMKIETKDWRNPFLVAAFGGWGDAASVATTSASFLLQNREARRLGELDAEEYFVLTATRSSWSGRSRNCAGAASRARSPSCGWSAVRAVRSCCSAPSWLASATPP